MPIFNASILNSISRASRSEDMAEELSESARRTIIFQVIQSYLNVLKNKEILNLQNEYLDLSELNYEKAERLYDAGRYSKTDAMRWQVDYQRQQSIVTTSQSNLRSSRIILSRLLNAAVGEFFEVEKRIPEPLLKESDELLKRADLELLEMIQLDDEALIQANSALAAAKKSEEISESAYRDTYNAYLPVLNFSYIHAWRENSTLALDDYSPKTILVNLSVPIFTSFQNYTRLKSSYYEYRRSQEVFNDQLLNIRLVLTEIINKLINLKTQRELSKISVEFNERNYNIVEQQREKGLVSNIELVDAKLNLQDAMLSDISNYYDFISGMVELYYLLGKLDKIVEREILKIDED
jgi:outer membrane protein